MNEIPIAQKNVSSFNKKAIKIIAILFAIGIIVGVILSILFVNEANKIIEEINDNPFSQYIGGGAPFDVHLLTASEIILPAIGVIIVCISMFLLIGLIIIYVKIALKTKSNYIVGLLFFLAPLLVQSIFSITALRSLFTSSVIPFGHIRESIGFGFGGFGGILAVLSLFEIIGLSILLYLSTE
ncbi:MAG: hypothetical protein NT038_07120 [Euryarchaeota archaeon]|nr:hypothetical protein [Euryarchaeota archaeon]